jgi:predicted nucleotidyltransferase
MLRALSGHRDELRRRYGVKSLALFGSVARDEAAPGSDVDLLVEFEAPPEFDGYMDLKYHLEERLGYRVDLVMKGALKPDARPVVEQEAMRVLEFVQQDEVRHGC